jgi:hypothetical protein
MMTFLSVVVGLAAMGGICYFVFFKTGRAGGSAVTGNSGKTSTNKH